MEPEPFRSPRTAPVPPEIPGYEVGEVIGRGAMGIVYRARQLNVDREVALKVLHPEHSGQKRLIRRLQREARTTARLAHPHVVSAIDMGEIDGSWWYAMEFVDGPSLALRLRQEGRLKEREALRLFIPLCEALEHLYEHGVVHRDIKPGNILIDKAGGARLADLGLAFADDDPKMTQGGTLGTPHYISPEQAIDASNADVRSDIWSFGATLFHAVCGRPPFSGESTAEILSAVLYSRIADPRELEPSLSKGLTLILRKCLTHEAENRYQTPRELLLDLERVRERRAPRVRRRALDPVQRKALGRRWLVGLGTAALIAIAAVAYLGERLGVPLEVAGDERDGPVEPYPELEDLLVRARQDPENLAQHRRDLADISRRLPAAHVPRWEEVDRALLGDLRSIVRAEERRAGADIQAALDARDFAAAHAVLRESFPERLLERTGYRLDALEAEGVSTAPWLDRTGGQLENVLRATAGELQDALGAWSGRRREEVERLVEQQEWRRAFAGLHTERDAVLADAGFADFRLPESYLDEAVEFGAATELFLARERLKDRWRELDRDLTAWVRTRAEILSEELELGRPRPRASESLRRLFALELEERRLSLAKMPVDVEGVTLTCLDSLERTAGDLLRREEQLLEEDARADLEETKRLSGKYWGERRYVEGRDLWSETADRLAALATRTEGTWRGDLERLARRRVEEGTLLFGVLRAAGAGVRDLDGLVLPEITIGAIRYTEVRLRSGLEPLEEGFYVEGIAGRIDLRDLPTEQLVIFAGMTDPAVLAPERRLALAAFLYHEGRFGEARAALSPELDLEGVLGELEPDLVGRVFDSIAGGKRLLEERTAEARRSLERVFDEEFQGHAPSNVVARIDLLIEQYADVPEVRQRLGELRSLREELRAGPKRSVEEILRAELDPTRLEFPRLRRVRLAFDLDADKVGAFLPRDWIFDGAGWVQGRRTQDWEGCVEQRGPRLVLPEPLEPDAFELVLELESIYDGPAQLFLVSVGGFHVALAGPGLPGSGRRSRYLIGTEDLSAFLDRVRRGEGTPVPELLEAEGRHVLVLGGYRPSGRLRLTLDGQLLKESKSPAPRNAQPVVEIRSWEPVRLRSLTIETGHSGR
jgi:serine/threonine-protein kinase